MGQEYSRAERVGDQIQRELAVLLLQEVKDPRVGMITITAVEVTKEFENARVFYTVMGDQDQREKTAIGLAKASGYLRRELSKRLKLRTTPQLKFVFDKSVNEGMRMTALINEAVSSGQTKKQ
jgi:ribosome-binding factor A